MKILAPTHSHIDQCAKILLESGLVAIPTETVYGLAANAFESAAVAKIFEAKERPHFDPLIVHISDTILSKENILVELENLNVVSAQSWPIETRDQVNSLMKRFWPGPLTLILPRGSKIPDLVTSGLSTVGVRVPNHPVAQELLQKSGIPLAAPSANRFGRISPTTANDVTFELEGKVDFVLDGGRSNVGVESTVVYANQDGSFTLLRPGLISLQDLEQELPQAKFVTTSKHEDFLSKNTSPGMLKNHYAPSKELYLFPKELEQMTLEDWQSIREKVSDAVIVGVLLVSCSRPDISTFLTEKLGKRVVVKVLSQNGDLKQAAHLLFGSLRVLDGSPADVILASLSGTNEGLGFAINDRLSKASTKV